MILAFITYRTAPGAIEALATRFRQTTADPAAPADVVH
ncbi:MAG: hypothetical protein JWQ21_3168 [Herminiimonas sp.]|nr:hypothetical protein [Herminiimonas sp.]